MPIHFTWYIARGMLIRNLRTHPGHFDRVFTMILPLSKLILPREIDDLQATEMMLFNERLSAQRALERGLVSKVFPRAEFMLRATELVEQYAKLPMQVGSFMSPTISFPPVNFSRSISRIRIYVLDILNLQSVLASKELMRGPNWRREMTSAHNDECDLLAKLSVDERTIDLLLKRFGKSNLWSNHDAVIRPLLSPLIIRLLLLSFFETETTIQTTIFDHSFIHYFFVRLKRVLCMNEGGGWHDGSKCFNRAGFFCGCSIEIRGHWARRNRRRGFESATRHKSFAKVFTHANKVYWPRILQNYFDQS